MIETEGLLALCAVALAFGAKHGFDADHLAAIDAIARHNVARKPWLARAAGALFAVGHGSIVTAVTCAATRMRGRWHTPHWLEASGSAISVIALLLLALVNLHALRSTPIDQPVYLSGIRARVLGRALAITNPLGVIFLGMLFAVSFDTVSQAALLGLAAKEAAAPGSAVLIAASFVCGMMAVDAGNSLWMADLLRRADRRAAQATRVMARTVAGLSLLVALLTALELFSPTVADWADQRALWLGASVILAGFMGFVVAMVQGRRHD